MLYKYTLEIIIDGDQSLIEKITDIIRPHITSLVGVKSIMPTITTEID